MPMFGSRPTENALCMAMSQQPNSDGSHGTRPSGGEYARPGDSATNTRPPGNGDRDEHDTERSEQKLHEVLGT
jgi:hypothetical protein